MESVYKILLAEDELKLAQVVQEELSVAGYIVDVAHDGYAAEKLFRQNKYALVLLDINLPGKSGMALCKEFREHNSKVPIIMVTALGELQDKIDAFRLGADDYITKPFHFDELLARIKVFIKRAEIEHRPGEKLLLADLYVDMDSKTVSRQGKIITLTAKEFALLVLLLRNQDKVLPKHEILEKVWELSFDTGTNTIEVYISFLRNKIDKLYEPKLIHTKAGFGYYIREAPLT